VALVLSKDNRQWLYCGSISSTEITLTISVTWRIAFDDNLSRWMAVLDFRQRQAAAIDGPGK